MGSGLMDRMVFIFRLENPFNPKRPVRFQGWLSASEEPCRSED